MRTAHPGRGKSCTDKGHGLQAMPLVCALALLLLIATQRPVLSAVEGSVSAAPVPPRLEVFAGYAGWIAPGVWVPLAVGITTSEALDGMLLVRVAEASRSAPVTTYQHRLRLGAVSRERIQFDVLIRDPRQPLLVTVQSGGREVARREVMLGSGRVAEGVVAALTRDAAGLEFLATLQRGLRPAYIQEADLPVRWQEYASLELVVIRDLDERRVLPAQRQALREWVLQGGRLLVTGVERTALPRASWLEELLPAVPTGRTREASAGLFPGLPHAVMIAVVTPKPGASYRPLAGGPLAVQWPRGRGTVVLWTFDAFSPALRAWSGLPPLWRDLLDVPPVPAIASRDLAGVLPTTQPLPSSAQIILAALSVLYILSIRVALRRLGAVRAGWVGITVVSLVFGAMLYGFSLTARSASTSITQASIVEAIPDADIARVTTFASLISPYGGPFTLGAPADAFAQPLTRTALTFSDGLREVTGAAPSSGVMFEVTQMVPLMLRGKVEETPASIAVEVVNDSGLVIRDAMLFRHRQAYRLPEIQARLSARLDPEKWETVGRAVPSTLDGQIHDWLFTRLESRPVEQIAGRDRWWLIGWIQDHRLEVTLQRSRPGQSRQMVVIPLEVVKGP